MVGPPERSRRGRLLVATPPLADPNFDRTVVLLLEHTDDGALGVVLNRPTDAVLHDVLSEWAPYASPPAVVHVGGPVSPEAVIALARGTADADAWVTVFDDVGTVDVGRDPVDLGAHLNALRVFVGYSGWGAGQLDDELAHGAWFVLDARSEDVFATDPATLWRDVLRRQRGRLAMFAHCPQDPTVN